MTTIKVGDEVKVRRYNFKTGLHYGPITAGVVKRITGGNQDDDVVYSILPVRKAGDRRFVFPMDFYAIEIVEKGGLDD